MPPRRSTRSLKGKQKPYEKPPNRKPARPKRGGKAKAKSLGPSVPTRLYLRINRTFLRRLQAATAQQPNPPPLSPLPGVSGILNVIVTDLPEILPFAGHTVDWLIRVARLIFEPLGTSSLYTFNTQSVEWWLEREMDPLHWRKVEEGEELEPTIYEFRPDHNVHVVPTRIGLRQARSVTTATSRPQATAFRNALLSRHQRRCIISRTQSLNILKASHLIPRRLGDPGVQSVFQRFTGSHDPVERYSPVLGVTLMNNLDGAVDLFDVGFWNYGPDQYVIHSFDDTSVNLYYGPPFSPHDPMLQGHQITLFSHDPLFALPPAGVFNWHYIQCVLKKFATPEYKAIDHINHFALPFRTDDDDSDVDFDDPRNIENPPYPSYFWDLAAFRAGQREDDEESRSRVMAWRSEV